MMIQGRAEQSGSIVPPAGAGKAAGSMSLLIGLWVLLAPAVGKADPPCASNPDGCPTAAAAESPRGLALGTGNRAAAFSTSALAYNTAGLPQGSLYHIEGNIDYQPANDVVVLGAAVVDSMTSKLAAGLSFRGSIANSSEGYSGIDFSLGLGFPFADEISVGLGGRYVNLWREDSYMGDDYKMPKGFTMDTALRVRPVDMLHLAFVAYNVIDRNSAYVPVTLGGSTTLVISDDLNLGADGLVDISSFDGAAPLFGGGLEYLSGKSVPLRLGYLFDTRRGIHAVTGGVGYASRKFSADFSLRQHVAGKSEDQRYATRLMAAVRFHLN